MSSTLGVEKARWGTTRRHLPGWCWWGAGALSQL